jgi:hypothetical protein
MLLKKVTLVQACIQSNTPSSPLLGDFTQYPAAVTELRSVFEAILSNDTRVGGVKFAIRTTKPSGTKPKSKRTSLWRR